jgi:hypothetical protein
MLQKKVKKQVNEEDLPLYIVRRRLYIKNMIIMANDNHKEETKIMNRKYVINGDVYYKIPFVKIDETKNTVKII